MQGLEVIAAKNKFRKIQKLNSQLFKLVHELSEDEWDMFLSSEYVFPIEPATSKSNYSRTDQK